jgi:RimJ/RimL family protein N-acetyltransferase
VIVAPKDKKQWDFLASFMQHYAHVCASPDTRFIGWVEQGELKMCVAFNAFLGRTCQIHVAMMPGYHFTPRKMMDACFHFAFEELRVSTLLGIVNSNNKKALRYDMHLGFKEEHRMPGMHDDNGDIVLLSMARADCKYLKEKEAA